MIPADVIRRVVAIAACAISVLAASSSVRGASWNEIVHGDLSGDPGSPTPLKLTHPRSAISGAVGDGDIDIITLEVLPYHTVASVFLLDTYTGLSQSFAGLQLGATWTAGIGGAINPNLLLGWTHFGPAASGAGVGDDILDNMATPKSGSAGFTVPLGPGLYTLYIQDTGGFVDYGLDFVVNQNLRPVGDFNGDGKINRFDLAKWRFEYLMNAGSDADGNGVSDGNDFLIWQRNIEANFNVATIPEPATVMMAIIAASAVLRRIRLEHFSG